MVQPNPVGDVMEACADALLTAAGAYYITNFATAPEMNEARELAIAALDTVIERTKVEGARSR